MLNIIDFTGGYEGASPVHLKGPVGDGTSRIGHWSLSGGADCRVWWQVRHRGMGIRACPPLGNSQPTEEVPLFCLVVFTQAKMALGQLPGSELEKTKESVRVES